MNFIRKHFRLLSYLALALVMAITTLSVLELKKIRFDYDFESFFPVNDPDLDIYLEFRETFEYDNEFVLLAVENKQGIFERPFLEKVQSLTDSLEKLPDVTHVDSPTNLVNYTSTGVNPPYIHLDDTSRYVSDSAIIYASEELVGSFFAPNAKSVSIFIKTTEGINKAESDRLVGNINRLVAAQQFDGVHIASKANGQKVYLEKLEREFFIFFIASFILVVTFLYISFRSFWGVWVPIIIVVLAITWTLALMTATGKALDIMTVLLPTMMFVVGMSDVVHIVTKYLEEMREGKLGRFDALLKTIRDVGFATFITLVTTALGFLTLLNSRIIPIRDFGLFTSLGVFIAFVLAFTIMPIVLNVLPLPNLRLERQASQFWNKRLLRLLLWIFRNGKAIAVTTIVLVLLSAWSISRINLNNYLIEGLTTRDELRQDFIFFETNFSGVRPFEIRVTPAGPGGNVLGINELRAMDKLETYLENEYGVGFLLSPVSAVKLANKVNNNGNPDYYRLPGDTSAINEITSTLIELRVKEDTLRQRAARKGQPYNGKTNLKALFTTDLKQARVTGKMNDVGSMIIREKNKELEKFLASTPEMKAIDVKLTGAAVMLDKNNEYLVMNTFQGLLISVLVVGLIIALIHRSWRMALVAVIPNLLPIVLIGGLMGLLGIELKSSTSIIFSIAFGIATDDTIHFLGRLKLERLKGKSLLYAVKRTFISTGKAVVVTSLILSAGFMTLISSGFESTFLFGLLVSITLLIAVVTDLLLFPLLVTWLIRDEQPRK